MASASTVTQPRSSGRSESTGPPVKFSYPNIAGLIPISLAMIRTIQTIPPSAGSLPVRRATAYCSVRHSASPLVELVPSLADAKPSQLSPSTLVVLETAVSIYTHLLALKRCSSYTLSELSRECVTHLQVINPASCRPPTQICTISIPRVVYRLTSCLTD